MMLKPEGLRSYLDSIFGPFWMHRPSFVVDAWSSGNVKSGEEHDLSTCDRFAGITRREIVEGAVVEIKTGTEASRCRFNCRTGNGVLRHRQ